MKMVFGFKILEKFVISLRFWIREPFSFQYKQAVNNLEGIETAATWNQNKAFFLTTPQYLIDFQWFTSIFNAQQNF